LRVADDVMAAFALLRWPGNVRQLANVVRTAVALLEDGEDTLTLAQLGDGGAGRHRPAGLTARRRTRGGRRLAGAGGCAHPRDVGGGGGECVGGGEEVEDQ